MGPTPSQLVSDSPMDARAGNRRIAAGRVMAPGRIATRTRRSRVARPRSAIAPRASAPPPSCCRDRAASGKRVPMGLDPGEEWLEVGGRVGEEVLEEALHPARARKVRPGVAIEELGDLASA